MTFKGVWRRFYYLGFPRGDLKETSSGKQLFLEAVLKHPLTTLGGIEGGRSRVYSGTPHPTITIAESSRSKMVV